MWDSCVSSFKTTEGGLHVVSGGDVYAVHRLLRKVLTTGF